MWMMRTKGWTKWPPPVEYVIINESGLYSIILSSKLPNAKKFKEERQRRLLLMAVIPSSQLVVG